MKNPVKPNSTLSNEPIPTTCPHCWFDFPPSDALFIATHPELIGDEALGEHQYKRLPRDEVVIKKGRATDKKYGFPITDRACPQCRLQIPKSMLRKSPIFVSMAGAPSAGKTYFIASLIHTLRRQLPQEFNLLLEYAISDEIDRIEKEVDKLFHSSSGKPVWLDKTQEAGGTVNNKVYINGQWVELPKPFLFSCRPSPNHFDYQKRHDSLHQNLALYDCSGEHFQYHRHKDTSNRSFGHFAKANAVLFVYDPLQDSPVLDHLESRSNDPQVHKQKHINHQEKTLEAVIHQLRILRQLIPETRIKAPLLIVVQKYDVWHGLLPEWAKIGPEAFLRSSNDGTSGVHIDELNKSSLHIRKFLFDICPMFVSLAEANFETVRYFAVSALGKSPVAVEVDVGDEYEEKKETRLCVFPKDISPFRVTDPILWLLAQRKLVPRARKQEINKTIPEAKITGTSDTNFQVVFPDSGQRMVLDNEYLGSTIFDPFTGTETKIPRKKTEKDSKGGSWWPF